MAICKRKNLAHIICGIEIEMNYNDNLLEFDCGSYHDDDAPTHGDYFYGESDSSIHSEKWNGQIELISEPFALRNWKKIIDNFKQIIEVQNSGNEDSEPPRELKELIEFNETTGCHIHLDLGVESEEIDQIEYKYECHEFNRKTLNFKRHIGISTLKTIKSKLANKVKRQLPELYNRGWIDSFAERRYAKAQNDDVIDRYTREMDWNFTNRGQRTIEFRAFTLRGVETWDELYKLFKIAFTTISKVLSDEINKEKAFESEVKHVIEQEFVVNVERGYAFDISVEKKTKKRKQRTIKIKKGNKEIVQY